MTIFLLHDAVCCAIILTAIDDMLILVLPADEALQAQTNEASTNKHGNDALLLGLTASGGQHAKS